ncbi:MAG TPA: amidohydrolase family protein, partial [Gammaproteobacteria bacterium]|nr:amidohydrolase family protein [Gammaproteobacteria bacterium]
SVVFASDRSGHYCLWSVDIETGNLKQLTNEQGDAAFPTVSHFGEIAYVEHDAGNWSLRVLPPGGIPVELETGTDELAAPSWRPGGGVLIYAERNSFESSDLKLLVLGNDPIVKTLTSGEDVFLSRAAWSAPGEFLYTADGRIWRRRIAGTTRHPVPLIAAASVAVKAPPIEAVRLDAEGPHPVRGVQGRGASRDGQTRVFAALGDLWLAHGKAAPRRLTNDAFADIDPSVSADGRFAVFASDRGGAMDLWRISLPTGKLTQLTSHSGKAHRPAVSPDGKRVAFLETQGFGPWADSSLRLLELSQPGEPRTLAADLIAPSRLRWTEEGRSLSIEVGTEAQRQRIEIAATAEGRSLPAGSYASAGETHAGRGETDDEERAGQADDAAGLSWQPAEPDEAYVVQVGQLFDGTGSGYRRNVDIHIRGQRIVEITPRNLQPLPKKIIDERDATVIPGLIDVEAQGSSLLGERLGRIWLAYGVTTVRDESVDTAAALEHAESWASGRRPGPRLVVSSAAAEKRGAESSAPVRRASPIPVRGFSALSVAYSLLQPGGPTHPFGAERPLAESYAARLPSRAGEADGVRISPLGSSYGDVLRTLAAAQTVVASELPALLGPQASSEALQSLAALPAFGRLYTDEERRQWLEPTSYAIPVPLPALERNTVRLIRAGVHVAVGSGAPAVPYGLGLHMELALLADAGIPNDQILRLATAGNALALGLGQQLGTLEAGKLADFVVLKGDPLQHLGDALKIIAVVKGGVWFDREQLLAGPPPPTPRATH